MANWRYTLKVGKRLRKAVHGENVNEVFEALKEAWREIHEQFPDEYDEDDLEMEIEDIEAVQSDDADYEDIDYLLDNLYDYCDNTRIWIEM